jgi:hypothetical protein
MYFNTDQYTFLVTRTSRSILLTVRNISEKNYREIQNTFMFNYFFPENPAVCGIVWEKTVEPDRSQRAIPRFRIACWMSKITDTHLEYVILNAFAQQQFLHERATMLRYTYIACLVSLMDACHRQVSIQYGACALRSR